MRGPLGRLEPTDWAHVDKYPLRTLVPSRATPVTLGINWYSAFDNPVRNSDGKYWIGTRGLGYVRGGHCVCIPSGGKSGEDADTWWDFYDQGTEGACVGFGSSRMMSYLNRKRYDAMWLYRQAQEVDEWPGDDYDGTSVRAAMDVLRTLGHRVYRSKASSSAEGIQENRWATTVDQVHACIQSPTADRLGAVPIRNSWGRSYPRTVWLPDNILNKLLGEDGEATLVVDRP